MLTLLLLFKIAVPPVLVALMSLAARRWGATIGGLIMGLPWMTGPVVFFLALDRGAEFGYRAAIGTELAVWSMCAFILAFGFASRIAPWWGSLPAAIAAFFATAALTRGLDLPLWLAALIGAILLVATFSVLPRPRSTATPGALPWWDIPARMACTFLLVAAIILSAERLGGQLSGIVASYPVILTVIGSFTLHQWGRDALLRVLRGISLSLLSFVAFFLVMGEMIGKIGPVAAFALATPAAVGVSALLVAWTRRQARRQILPTPSART